MRARDAVPPEYDFGLSLAQLEETRQYRLAWTGDGSALMVAIEMPTLDDGGAWDFSSYESGRMSPTIDDAKAMAEGDRSRKRGSFLKFSWSSVLADNTQVDHLGAFTPLTLKDAVGITTCSFFDGTHFGVSPTAFGMYGDSFPLLKPKADTYGYLRQYDVGSCSAGGGLFNLIDTAVRGAATPTVQKQSGPIGDVTIRTDHIQMVLEPALADQVAGLPLPVDSSSSPFRNEQPDGMDFWFHATGTASSSFLGADVNCDFDATYSARIDFSVDPAADNYFNRFRMSLSDEHPSAQASNCSSSLPIEILDDVVNAIVDWAVMPFNSFHGVDLSLDALANSKNPSTQLRGHIANQLSQAAASANELTMMPIPSPEALRTVQATQVPTLVPMLIDEWRNGHEMTPSLELPANGPAGSCLSANLDQIDNGQCNITPSLERISSLDPLLSEAIQFYVAHDPHALECRPSIGGAAYAAETSRPPQFIDGSLLAYRTFDGLGCDNDGFGRLFVEAGEIFAACVHDYSPECHACYYQQDSGTNCDFQTLLTLGCLSLPANPFPESPQWPQVSCRPTKSASPDTLCAPRFRPRANLQEGSAICVPFSRFAAKYLNCRPCLALFSIDASAADVQACLEADEDCRVLAGTAAKYCDATNLFDTIHDDTDKHNRIARIMPPFRCGLRLPVSRTAIEPDRLDVMLSEAFACPNGTTAPCRIQQGTPLTLVQAKTVIWQELLALAGSAGVGADAFQVPGFDPPSCFPNRNEAPGGFDPLNLVDTKPFTSGPMGWIGQGERGADWQHVVNSPLCGWLGANGNGPQVMP